MPGLVSQPHESQASSESLDCRSSSPEDPWVVEVILPTFDQQHLELVIQIRQPSSNNTPGGSPLDEQSAVLGESKRVEPHLRTQ